MNRMNQGCYTGNSFNQDEYYQANAADFSERFLAFFIDALILTLISIPLMFIVGGWASTSFPSLLGWLYFALQESSPKQATLGKQKVGIIVTDLNGNRISFFEASIRYFMKYVSGAFFGIGYLIQPFTKKRQALHDMIAGCLVMNKR